MSDKKTKITENIAKKSLFKKSKIPGSIFLELKNPKALAKLVIKKDSGGEMLKGKQKELDKNKDGKISGEDFKMMKARVGKSIESPGSKANKLKLAKQDKRKEKLKELRAKGVGPYEEAKAMNQLSMGGEPRGYGAARTSGMGLQDEELIPGKSLDYYKDVM